MAITIEQSANSTFNTGAGGSGQEVLLSRAKLVNVYSSTSTAQTNFKYLIQVEEDGTEIFKSYITPNPSSRCVFDLSPIVKERLKAPVLETASDSSSIHEGLFSTFPFNKCEGGQKIYEIKVGEVYEVSGTLTEFPNLDNHEMLVINGHQDYKDSFHSAGIQSQDLVPYSCNYTSPVEIEKGFLSKIDANTYKQTKNNEYFRNLAGASIAVPTRETDLGCISWIHDDVYVNNDTTELKYEWFNSAGTSLQAWTYDATDVANNGQALNATTSDGKVLCSPMHWGALSNNGSFIGTFTNALAWEYYTIQLIQADSNVANFKWAFYKDCTGNKNELYQLAWTNGVGFWDYFTFKPQTMHEESASKKQYNTNVGTYGGSDFMLYPFDAGTKNYQVIPKRSWTLSSGKIDEELSKYLKEIIRAKQVQLITPEGDVLPVIVDTNSTNFYRDRTNKLYDFQIKVTLAQSLEG